jgi:hypothetical protein
VLHLKEAKVEFLSELFDNAFLVDLVVSSIIFAATATLALNDIVMGPIKLKNNSNKYQIKPQIKSTQTNSNPKSNQLKSTQTNSNQLKSAQPKQTQIYPNQFK